VSLLLLLLLLLLLTRCRQRPLMVLVPVVVGAGVQLEAKDTRHVLLCAFWWAVHGVCHQQQVWEGRPKVGPVNGALQSTA